MAVKVRNVYKKGKGVAIGKRLKRDWQIYMFLLPTLLYFFIFCYIPMAGIQIAFKEFTPYMGMFRSPWVGMEQFKRFFDSYQFKTVITNTLKISLSNLVFGFPVPILLALMINQLNFKSIADSNICSSFYFYSCGGGYDCYHAFSWWIAL